MTATSNGRERRCLVTGANGYVGRCIVTGLRASGWNVIELVRRPQGAQAMAFELGAPIAPEALRGFDALVHCAYDQKAVSWPEIVARNVRGSEILLEAARSAGVRDIVYISTISAFAGCRSLYGKGKLKVEAIARELDAWVIRPGLVYGDHAGGTFGQLVKTVQSSSIVPIPGSGRQLQYLVHEEELAAAIGRCLEGDLRSTEPVTIAHDQPWAFREILSEIARVQGRRVRMVPVPWQLIWLGLRSAEGLNLPISARSDSLISLNNQTSSPRLNARSVLGITCRPFAAPLLQA